MGVLLTADVALGVAVKVYCTGILAAVNVFKFGTETTTDAAPDRAANSVTLVELNLQVSLEAG